MYCMINIATMSLYFLHNNMKKRTLLYIGTFLLRKNLMLRVLPVLIIIMIMWIINLVTNMNNNNTHFEHN